MENLYRNSMDYENYMELYEAVYFFNRINCCVDNKLPQPINKEDIKRLGINESIYKAILRILAVNNLLDYDGSCFIITNENIAKHRYILDNIINKEQNKQYAEFFNKAINESQYFFDSICAEVEKPDNLIHTTYSLLNAVLNEEDLPKPNDFIIPCEKIDVIPCNISLSAIELNRSHEIGSERALQTVIAPLKEMYDFILIDTYPSFGILTVNVITASDGVPITVTSQLLSAIGLKLLIKTIQKVQRHINQAVKIKGVLMTMCDTRTNLYKDIEDIMAKTYKDSIKIFDTIIPSSTKVGEANMYRQSVVLYDEKSKSSQAYRDFAKELILSE